MYCMFRKTVMNIKWLQKSFERFYCVLRVLIGAICIIRVFIRGFDEESCGAKLPLILMEFDSYGASKRDKWVLRGNMGNVWILIWDKKCLNSIFLESYHAQC